MILLIAGCTGGSDVADGIATDGQITTNTDGDATDPDTSAGEDSDSTDADAGNADGDPGTPDGSDDEPAQALFPGQCSAEQVNRQPFYAVANIEDDDPDGGLNVRDDYDGGEKLATLVEGSVVHAEDCFQSDGGAVWYSITTNDGINGWVNAAFLSTTISALEPTFRGTETAEQVEVVLDALAARRWEVAAEALMLPGSEFSPLEWLIATPGSSTEAETPEGTEAMKAAVAAQLQAYCSVRICDAPYVITDVRGSYVPSRVSPEVDVQFTYSGGIVTETFSTISLDDVAFSLDTLPGQSILAFNRTQPSAVELASNSEGAPAGLLDAAEVVRRALLSESGPPIPDDYMPAEGVVVSSDAYIDPVPANRSVVTAADLASNGDEERIWGYSDGVGVAIVRSVDGWMASYRRFDRPARTGHRRHRYPGRTREHNRQPRSVVPNAHTVEFHRMGRGQLSDFNWSSVRLAMELRDRQWIVVGITLDTWTI